ncbi:hypothetical protein [Laceyella sacchari]|uniref:Phospholipid phosphatase n=1 Tax=Laceyella sacchari TaxID=37482 RepID=A0ABY5U1Q0_LACSH|nr:hypothetical protein [Laceyella sacchari]TCW39092.1 hypothetical protein EDC32_102337 [Laceyella sacchari]UWE03428.1 hypothetical protein NYR52_15205 [Laceyella sacchari]
MDVFLYPILTVAYIALFIWSFRFIRESAYWGTYWLMFITLAMIYDNAILALGNWIGEGDMLEGLSLVRSLFHVLLTPTLVFVALDIVRRLRLEWTESLLVQVLYHLYTFVVTVMGIFMEILWVDMEPVVERGLLRYAPVQPQIPCASALVLVPLLISGILVWRKLRWPVLLIGLLLVMIGGSGAVLLGQPALSAVFVFIFIWVLVLTEQMLLPEDYGPINRV